MIYTAKQRSRFWSNVVLGDADSCWLWKKSVNSKGYGQVSLTIDTVPRILKAHKVAWEMANDRAIAPGARAKQTCGQLLCCNPKHLELTPSSTQDRPRRVTPTTQKARGQDHGAAKLTDRQVRIIKYKLSALSTTEVADLLNVRYHSIYDIRSGQTWKHI